MNEQKFQRITNAAGIIAGMILGGLAASLLTKKITS